MTSVFCAVYVQKWNTSVMGFYSWITFPNIKPGSCLLLSLTCFPLMLPAVADVLVDAALVLGGDTVLKILYMKLVQV